MRLSMARILLVDDDYDIRELGRAILSHLGHDVHTSDGAMNALHVLRAHTFDLLITDANMPNVSGYDLLKMVRGDKRWQDLTTVMLTGRREKKDVERAKLEGVSAYIVKPIDPVAFTAKIDEILLQRKSKHVDFIAAPADDGPHADFAIRANVKMAVEIHSISEIGITLRSTYQFKSGTLLPIDSDIFKRIGISPPLMRVFLSQKRDGDWETKLTYADLSDQDAEKIRRFTSRQNPGQKNTGSKGNAA